MGSALIKVRFENEMPQLLLSQNSFRPNVRSFIGRRKEWSNIADFHIDGLQPDTEYFYGFSAQAASSIEAAGRLRTFPDGAASFRFVFASCARTGSKHDVFNTILQYDPLFFLQVGDLHYRNIERNDCALFQKAYSEVFSSNVQGALYGNVPLIYVWDDHDFGPNNSDRFAPGRIASRLTYQECVPHYPLAFGTGDVPICHAFSVGRVRFVVTDLRSERSRAKSPDGPDKTMLGSAQKEWFKRELLSAKSSFALIFWVSSVPWTGKSHTGDGWAVFSNERQEIADFLQANGIRNLCILSGDAHMLGADDGRNGDFASDGGAPVPSLQAAPLDREASFKGGPYSHGHYLPKRGEGCFGSVEVHDNGREISVLFIGRNHRDEKKVSMSFTVAEDGKLRCSPPLHTGDV
jgi:phosphodiesterase/alkaline phosphatase D-like protein